MKKKLKCGCEIDLEKLQKQQIIVCGDCGSEVYDAPFCGVCGYPLGGELI